MQYGSTEIITPMDNPVQFDPHWRSAFAVASLEFPDFKIEPEFIEYKDDERIRRRADYL